MSGVVSILCDWVASSRYLLVGGFMTLQVKTNYWTAAGIYERIPCNLAGNQKVLLLMGDPGKLFNERLHCGRFRWAFKANKNQEFYVLKKWSQRPNTSAKKIECFLPISQAMNCLCI